MANSADFTVRIDVEKQKQLDALANEMNRSIDWLVNQAIEQFLEEQAWQIAEIKKGIEAADRGELIPHAEVMARIAAKINKV